jgi:serine/threonine protein phosphatase PrpC
MPDHERPAARASLASASLSAAGGRPDNQDRCGEGPTGGGGRAYVVADGLGGHAAGELAAERAVAAVLASLAGEAALAPGALARAFEAAGAALRAVQRERREAWGCRTTAVVLAVEGGLALWGHVGDSRLYRLHGGRAELRTRDHSVPQALVDSGVLASDAIRHHPDRNRLLRSLGGDEPVDATLAATPVAIAPGDAFLLCTDGFWELVPEPAMESALAAAGDPADWLRRLEAGLLAAARGPFDNYTAIAVVAAVPEGGPRPGLAARLRARWRVPGPRPGAGLHSAPTPPAAAAPGG